MSSNELAQAAVPQGTHLKEDEAWLLESSTSTPTSESDRSTVEADHDKSPTTTTKEEEEDEYSKYEEGPVYVIGTVKTTTEAIELIRRNQRLAAEYEEQVSHTHRAKKSNNNNSSSKEEEDVASDDFVDWDDDFVYLRVPKDVMSEDTMEDEEEKAVKYAKNEKHTTGSPSSSSPTTTTTTAVRHDLPATLREFRERARYTVTLAIARSAVMDDALQGFTKEVEHEKAALRVVKHEYEAWKAEQHLHVEHKAATEPHNASTTTTTSSSEPEATHKAAEHDAQKEVKTTQPAVHVDVNATPSPDEEQKAEEIPTPATQHNALQSAPEVNAELRYRTYVQERAFCDSRLPQFLRLVAPPDLLTPTKGSPNTKSNEVSSETSEHAAVSSANQNRPSLLRLLFINPSAAEGYPGAMTPTSTKQTNSVTRATQPASSLVVRREWVFVWKQFLRDIHREVFLIENVGYHDADLAAAALLSYLEHCYSRGQAELLQRRQRRQAECEATSAVASGQEDEENTSLDTQSPSHASEHNTAAITTQSHDERKETASPSANNALVLRGLIAAGALGLHAALPPFMRLPLGALLRSVQERQLARARAEHMRGRSQSHSELYPSDEVKRARLLYEAARLVLLAGQQSFMAFPYQLLYEQVGMNRLAGVSPYEETTSTSSSSSEDEGESKKEEEEAEGKDNALHVRDIVTEDARVTEDNPELPGSPLRTTADDKGTAEERSTRDESATHTPHESVHSPAASHKAEAAAKRRQRRRARMQDRPLMIGEPNTDEFCRFLRRIRARVRARDEHVKRLEDKSEAGHEAKATAGEETVISSSSKASLFREDVDGSVYLIPVPVIPLSVTNAPQQQQQQPASENEAKAREESDATTLLRRGTRIHVYYSETQGLPMVCVSKVFRLATLQPRATPKASETAEQVKLRRKEMAGMVVLLLMQVQFALFTDEEVEVKWRWYVL